MSHNIAVLLLGTNIGERERNLENAILQLIDNGYALQNKTVVLKTDPVEFSSENYFLNQIITVKVGVSPLKLLRDVKQIEEKMGRIYTSPKMGEKYTDRIIDIDILKFDEITYKTKELEIPHPRNFNRNFVVELYAML